MQMGSMLTRTFNRIAGIACAAGVLAIGAVASPSDAHASCSFGSGITHVVYLQVDNSGLMPDVTSIDLFGVDTVSGKALHEHVARG